jgi:hypothetical protein
MNDNLTRYSAIQKALKSLRPTEPKGNVARHLNTLAMMIAGMVGSQKCHLPAVAKKVPIGGKPQSRVRRFERFVANKAIDTKTYYLPYVQCLLASLPQEPWVLVIDGSEAGRQCVLLSINVIYKKRALPLCWTVVKGKKGHLPEQTHKELVEKVAELVPAGQSIVFLGDGEFDGTNLLSTLHKLGWDYVCRTAKNVLLTEEGERFQPTDLMLAPGDRIELPEVGFTAEEYGPVLVGIVWDARWKEPLILVSNLDFLEEAYDWYQRRFRIETFFSDQKSRGFYLGHSHISDPAHLERLLIGTCLAYLWMVCLGAWVMQSGRVSWIHRTDRCDWSLFHIGLSWIEYCLNEGIPIRTLFTLYEGGQKSVG